MWTAFIATLLCFALMVPRLRRSKSHQKKNEVAHDGIIVELGFGSLFWYFIKAYTVHRNRPSYELSFEQAKKYGSVVVLHLRKLLPTRAESWISSIDLDLSKKILSSPLWAERSPANHYMFKTTFDKPYGLLGGNGEYYRRASRLVHRLLHQFEFFKPSRTQGYVLFEAQEVESELVSRVAVQAGAQRDLIICPHGMFERNTLNVIWQVIMGARFARDDPMIGAMLDSMNKANREFRLPLTILEAIPALRHLPRLTFLGSSYEFSHFMYRTLQEMITEKRRDLLLYSGEPKDLMDGFILEIDKADGGGDEYMNDQQLMVVMRDLVAAGADTVNSALEHSILHLALNPDIQDKVQAEIDHVIGHSRAITYEDKAEMPYTQATLLEILRVGSPVPGTVRTVKEDASINGVNLAKGSVFFLNIYGLHRGSKIWEDPDVFRPERFLDSTTGKLINTEKILPFGIGKRSCLGESVAQVSLFIFFVTLFRKFRFNILPDHPPPSFKNVHGVSRCPVPFYVQLQKRF